MNIVLASDNGYIDHCATTMTSIMVNNKDVHVFILTEWLSDENIERLNRLANIYGGTVEIIQVDGDKVKKLPMPKLQSLSHISLATYYRLFIANLLPENIEKVIYLDCDIIVRKSLDEMWNIDIEHYALGAVYQIASWNVEAITRLGYNPQYGYFNAGVLLINLKYWRDNSIQDLFIKSVREIGERIVYHDQDILNYALHDSTLRLSCKYNMLTSYFTKSIYYICDMDANGKVFNNHDDYKRVLKGEIKDPCIIHYVSRPKPWDKQCTHPFRNDYIKYAKMCDAYNDLGFKDDCYYILKEMLRKIGFSYYV
ncbi:MAG: glycosyltransferase family 8 protein [Prevotella sp.]|nr:glycosyltransferase family 8 protein [Prevotella sp.]